MFGLALLCYQRRSSADRLRAERDRTRGSGAGFRL